jgi:hypothetical protein
MHEDSIRTLLKGSNYEREGLSHQRTRRFTYLEKLKMWQCYM